ncbi:MAG: hypothetical protein QOG81_1583 [Gaiellaceae bacterium]|nr:hypothetical protein [Gaiellaceae bacterium]
MRAEHLYRLRFSYPESWAVGAGGPKQQNFGIAEGRCEGRVSGRFRGANHARVRPDGTYLPDVQGYITTDDGAEIVLDLRGRGRVRDDVFRATGTATHVSGDERYSYLNDVVCAIEAGSDADDEEVAVDVYELVWEPIAE